MGNSCMENTLSAFSKKNQPPYTIEQHTAVDDVSSLVYQLNITLHQAKVAGEGAEKFILAVCIQFAGIQHNAVLFAAAQHFGMCHNTAVGNFQEIFACPFAGAFRGNAGSIVGFADH